MDDFYHGFASSSVPSNAPPPSIRRSPTDCASPSSSGGSSRRRHPSRLRDPRVRRDELALQEVRGERRAEYQAARYIPPSSVRSAVSDEDENEDEDNFINEGELAGLMKSLMPERGNEDDNGVGFPFPSTSQDEEDMLTAALAASGELAQSHVDGDGFATGSDAPPTDDIPNLLEELLAENERLNTENDRLSLSNNRSNQHIAELLARLADYENRY